MRPPNGHLLFFTVATALLETEGSARGLDDLTRELAEGRVGARNERGLELLAELCCERRGGRVDAHTLHVRLVQRHEVREGGGDEAVTVARHESLNAHGADIESLRKEKVINQRA